MKKTVFPIIMCVILAAWSAGVCVFFAVNSGRAEVCGINAGFTAFTAAMLFLSAVLASAAAKGIRASEKKALLLYLPPILLTLIYVFAVPYSPSHDAYDISGFAEQMHNLGGFKEYAAAYLTFTSANRLTLFMYYPFMLLFGGIEAGARVLNAFMLFIAMFSCAETAANMFGRESRITAMYVFAAFAPFTLLSAPYIYLPVICFFSLALMLFSKERLWIRAAGILPAAAVYILRPTSFGALLVFALFYGLLPEHEPKRLIKNIASVIIIAAAAIGAKAGLGTLLYAADLYPYPGLNSSAAVWSLELGTRMQDEDTGLCTYSGYDTEGFDDISSDFHRLWELRAKENPADISEISSIQSSLRVRILSRFVSEVVSKPDRLWYFLKTKYKNYFADGYASYYSAVNVNRENAAAMLYKNYPDRYYISENGLLCAYHISAFAILLAAVFALARKRSLTDSLANAVVMTLAAAAVAVVTILFAEVGKRLMFDIYVPMLLTLCFAAEKCALVMRKKSSENKKALSAKTALTAFLCVMCALTAAGCYSYVNNDIFKGCTVTSDDSGVTIALDGTHYLSEISAKTHSGDVTLPVSSDEIHLPPDENRADYCVLTLSGGKKMRLAKLRVHKFEQ